MNKGFVLSIFQEYVATFMDDDPDAFNEKRLTDDLARDSTSDNENIDEILLYGASSAGAVRITEFLLSLGVKATFFFNGRNAFHAATRNWHVCVMKRLLRSDPTLIDTLTTDGELRLAPLGLALLAFDMAPLTLCEHAVDLDLALQQQHRQCSMPSTVALLLRWGAKVNRTAMYFNGKEFTALEIAVRNACSCAANGTSITAANSLEIVGKLLFFAGNQANNQLCRTIDTPVVIALRSLLVSRHVATVAEVSDAEDVFIADLVRLLLEYGARSDTVWLANADERSVLRMLRVGEPLNCLLLAVHLGAHHVLNELLLMRGDSGVVACEFTGNRALTTLEFIRQYVHRIDPQSLACWNAHNNADETNVVSTFNV